MQNPAFNPKQPGNFHFQDEASAFAAGDEIAAAQDGLLNEALAIGHAPSIAAALGLVARMRGMSELAAATGIRRQNLCRALGPGGNPTLDTLTRVTCALGYRLSAAREGGAKGRIEFGIQPHPPGGLSPL
jgi:probable addiction module antidote protein